MRHALARPAIVALGACLAACGHAPRLSTQVVVPAHAISWPGAPARPIVRLAWIVSNLPPGSARGSRLRRAVDFVTGHETSSEERGLVRPFGVTASGDGGFLVADPDAARVLRFDRAGAFSGDVTCRGHDWVAPIGVAEPTAGTLLVLDAGAAAVLRWERGACRPLDVRLARPTGIAASAGMTLIADPGAREVVVLSAAGSEEARWSATGSDEPLLPSDVAIGADGTVFVVDGLNARIVHFTADGRRLGYLGQPAATDDGLVRPKGVHVDLSGRVFVSDAQRDQVLVYEADGTLAVAVGGPGDAPGEFAHPAGLGGRGSLIFVADSLNRRIQVLETTGANP